MVTARRSFNISDILEPEKDLVAQLQRTHNLSVSPDKSISLSQNSPSFPVNISVGLSTPPLWTASLPRYVDSIAPGFSSRLSSFLPTQTLPPAQAAALGSLYTLGLSPYAQLQSHFGKYAERYQELLTPYTTKNGTSQRRVRTIFTKLQLMALESLFQQQHYLSPHKRRETAFLLNLNETQVQTWFQNRRAKCKRKIDPVDLMDKNSNSQSALQEQNSMQSADLETSEV
ncbi:homeobox protein ceh-12-like isoform X2 [Bolinopsis microptera]|uniref:homeobox protein ceh-12-like isoform X2 n=1 Tax=Bolinopsis microptera TaxID=2820187 RepID=UPI00307A745D